MINAKTEFLNLVEYAGRYKQLICAVISVGNSYETEVSYILKKFHNHEVYQKFLDNIDKTYDDGYGGQNLFGTVWFSNGKWAERGEYDGSEWWELKSYPEIPAELL